MAGCGGALEPAGLTRATAGSPLVPPPDTAITGKTLLVLDLNLLGPVAINIHIYQSILVASFTNVTRVNCPGARGRDTKVILTFLPGRLQRMATLETPAGREYVPGVVAAPIIERAAPAVERDVYHVVFNSADGRCADQLRVLLVDRFELVPDLEHVGPRCLWLAFEHFRWRHFRAVQRLQEEHRPAGGVHSEAQRWLQHAARFLAMADRMDFVAVDQAPEIVLVVRTVQPQSETGTKHTDHGCDTG